MIQTGAPLNSTVQTPNIPSFSVKKLLSSSDLRQLTFYLSAWHIFWHSIWHSNGHTHISSGILSSTPSCIHSDTHQSIWHSNWHIISHPSGIHSDNSFWHVFGSACAQTDLELTTGFGPVHAQTAVELAIGFGSVHARTAVQHELLEQNCYSTLELALAVKSRSIGAHSDNKLAEGGSEEGWRRRRRRMRSCTLVKILLKSRDPHCQVGNNSSVTISMFFLENLIVPIFIDLTTIWYLAPSQPFNHGQSEILAEIERFLVSCVNGWQKMRCKLISNFQLILYIPTLSGVVKKKKYNYQVCLHNI